MKWLTKLKGNNECIGERVRGVTILCYLLGLNEILIRIVDKYIENC